MYVWNYYGNVPVVGVIVGSIVVDVVGWLGVHGTLVQCWFGVVVQTFVVACLMSKMENDRPVELSLYGQIPYVENDDSVILLWPCVPMCCKHCV